MTPTVTARTVTRISPGPGRGARTAAAGNRVENGSRSARGREQEPVHGSRSGGAADCDAAARGCDRLDSPQPGLTGSAAGSLTQAGSSGQPARTSANSRHPPCSGLARGRTRGHRRQGPKGQGGGANVLRWGGGGSLGVGGMKKIRGERKFSRYSG